MMEKRRERLTRSFFARPATVVAEALLGQRLVRWIDGQRIGGRIVETEAYCDAGSAADLACHGDRANKGQPTARTAVMFGPPGFSYVYFTYGIHWMFNIVTGEKGQANAVLIRAMQPEEGLDHMRAMRGRSDPELTNGPAKLAQALSISGQHNGCDLCAPESSIWLETGQPPDPADMARGPRIGLGKVPEPWFSMPWRYWLAGNPFVSR